MRLIIAWLSVLFSSGSGELPVATNYLFDKDDFVVELRAPINLFQFIQGLENYAQPYCERSRIFLLYSGHCPHCHAFQPTWSAFGKGVRCAHSNIEVGAFECVGKDKDRMNTLEEWKTVQNNLLNISDEDGDGLLSPREICTGLKNEYYPTLVLAIANSCRLRSPFKKFKSFDSKIDLYHIPVDSQSTNMPSLNEMLLKEKLTPSCAQSMSSTAMDDQIKKWLTTYEATPRDQRPRWDTRAVQVTPHYRIYEAALGLFHILDAWILSERVNPTKQEIIAIENFIKLARATSLDAALRDQLTNLLNFIRKRLDKLTSTEWQVQIRQLNIYGLTMEMLHNDPLKYSLTCSQPSCLVWTFLHVAAQSSLLRANRDVRSGNNTQYLHLLKGDGAGQVQIESELPYSDAQIRAEDFLETLRDLIYYFFDCKSCRSHFVQAYEQCAADGCRWTESGIAMQKFGGHADLSSPSVGLVLYLWRFHNIVTMRTATGHTVDRLRVDFNEDPTGNHTRLSYLDTDVRLPTEGLCGSLQLRCKRDGVYDAKITKGLVEAMMDTGDDDSKLPFDHYDDYDLTAILSFLARFYVPEEIAQEIGNIKTLMWNKDELKMRMEIAANQTNFPALESIVNLTNIRKTLRPTRRVMDDETDAVKVNDLVMVSPAPGFWSSRLFIAFVIAELLFIYQIARCLFIKRATAQGGIMTTGE